MLRKWTILGLTMASVTALATGFAMAQDEDSPLHKLMEQVNAKTLAITKAVRTPVSYKKSLKVVADSATELLALRGVLEDKRLGAPVANKIVGENARALYGL